MFAEVKRKKAREGDSHNLGKTTLIALIDFLLLKEIVSSDHFLDVHKERFKDFVFYMELALHDGGFATVRRAVAEPTRIALLRTPTSLEDARPLNADAWDHWDIALAPARQALDAYLNLRMIEPYDYRTGVSYFLRTQADYTDYFQIQKFMRGQDRAWKPYLAAVLGLDHEAVLQKYSLEEDIAKQESLRDARLAEVDPANRDRGELATRIEIARDEIGQIDTHLDGFDFHEVEVQINKRVVEAVETKLNDLGQEMYDLEVDIAQLETSISSGIKFDLARIREIFAESEILFPYAIAKSYEDLVDFNRQLTRERNKALRDRVKELQKRHDKAVEEHKEQSAERQRLMAIVQEADTFRKYKALQKGRNTKGNIEFEIRTKSVSGAETSQDKGHSYHRLLCALFDLAVLKSLETMPFYHFVYHDGILEGLDNRVKLRLLGLIREAIASGRVQYILSLIDSDLPRKIEDEEQIPFAKSEVVLTLSDQGDSGRLF
ncbi:MAG: DUF2326 domain-containing protein, partial [Terricaulis sp.]